jgi:LmeA-like phospholipid-binding
MRRIAALAIVALVLLLAVAQLVLPGIAEQRLRDRLARSGKVLKVEVDAFPAIQLLWRHADRVVVRVASYRSSPGHLGGLLGQAHDVDSLDVSAEQLDAGLLTLRDTTLRMRGSKLIGTARITDSDLRAAVPILDGIRPVASGAGPLRLRGTLTFLGETATVDATVATQAGQLVVRPDVPLGSFAGLTVFSDPHVVIENVSATAVTGGIVVTASGRLK